MNSLINERTFWSDEGWFVYLRKCDKNLVSYVGSRRLNIRKGEFGVIAGPFISQSQLETWFEGFLSRHAQPREMQTFTGEQALNTYLDGSRLELMVIDDTRKLENGNVRFHFA